MYSWKEVLPTKGLECGGFRVLEIEVGCQYAVRK